MPIDSRKVAEQAAEEIYELSIGYDCCANVTEMRAIISKALDAHAAAVLRGAAQEFEQSESNWHGYEAAELLERLAAQQEKK